MERIGKLLTIASIGLTVQTNIVAQETAEDDTFYNERRLALKAYPQALENDQFMLFYSNRNKIYANNGNLLAADDSVVQMKISPSLYSVACLQKPSRKNAVCRIYDITRSTENSRPKVLKDKKKNFIALAYSPDAKQLAVAAEDSTVSIYNATGDMLYNTLSSTIRPAEMAYSPDRQLLCLWERYYIEVWNMEKYSMRQKLRFKKGINHVRFSNDNKHIYVLEADGNLSVIDTSDLKFKNNVNGLGVARQFCIDKNDKYIAAISADNQIMVVNLLDTSDRQVITDQEGGISNVKIAYSEVTNTEQPCLVYNTHQSLVYKMLTDLKPNFNKMMATELNERLNEWVKQMPGETLEEYEMRVNDETRAEKARQLEREIATRMADGTLKQSDVTIGDYNPTSKKLALNVKSMPNIYLDVDASEIAYFDDNSKLEYRNMKYGLNADDNFELVYVEVYNPATDKSYTFNNMKRESLSYIEDDINFVPMTIVKQASMEETMLKSIKEDVVEEAQQQQLISDKTHISVNTNAMSAKNADGEKIVNYVVEFNYEVEEEYSARDDFKPGHYQTNESGAAMSMLSIMKKAFETDFAQYIKEGKRVKVRIKGTADALPINRPLPYDGRYGEFNGEPVYKGNELNNISLTRAEGIANNEQLAFVRAVGVQDYMEKDLSLFSQMQHEYEYQIEVSKEEGSKYRRISVVCTFYDAF